MSANKKVRLTDLGKTIEQDYISKINSGTYMLGVVGTMGSGKSYTSNQLYQIGNSLKLNVTHIKLDDIRIEVLSNNPQYYPIRQKLAKEVGTEILKADTSIDRIAFRQILFDTQSSYDIQKLFNTVMNKPFSDYIQNIKKDKTGLFLVEWPTLHEHDGFNNLTNDNYLAISCDYDIQVKRLLQSSNLTLSQIQKGISSSKKFNTHILCLRLLQAIFEKGNVYTFDTTNNPKSEAHHRLLEKIITTIN
jgi:dephospho-CoA kinase